MPSCLESTLLASLVATGFFFFVTRTKAGRGRPFRVFTVCERSREGRRWFFKTFFFRSLSTNFSQIDTSDNLFIYFTCAFGVPLSGILPKLHTTETSSFHCSKTNRQALNYFRIKRRSDEGRSQGPFHTQVNSRTEWRNLLYTQGRRCAFARLSTKAVGHSPRRTLKGKTL